MCFRVSDAGRSRCWSDAPPTGGDESPCSWPGSSSWPIRAVLYTLSDNSFWLIGVQLLDGVGAGVFGALTPLVIADESMRGTGRFNLAQGAIARSRGSVPR